MRQTKVVAPEDSLVTATSLLRENGTGLLPVVADERFRGVLTESRLTQALADGRELSEAVSEVMAPWDTIAPYSTGAQALRLLSEMRLATLVVIDDDRRVLGLLSASDLVPRRRPPIRPATIGGMASPFGVYLTTGTVSGGVSQWALMATGATMFALLYGGQLMIMFAAMKLAPHVPTWVTSESAQTVAALAVFAIGMRLIPMSGIHAAEHQVVHAIERGEELRPEIVSRMPRVHPRCGTNLAAGLAIFLGICAVTWIPDLSVRAMIGALTALFFWRKVGAIAQFYVTTRPASPKQIESGIKAGQQLLERYSEAKTTRPNVWKWVWYSGLLHVIAGSAILGTALIVIGHVFHISWMN